MNTFRVNTPELQHFPDAVASYTRNQHESRVLITRGDCNLNVQHERVRRTHPNGEDVVFGCRVRHDDCNQSSGIRIDPEWELPAYASTGKPIGLTMLARSTRVGVQMHSHGYIRILLQRGQVWGVIRNEGKVRVVARLQARVDGQSVDAAR